MDVTLQDLLNQIDDYNQNYNVSNIDLGNKLRAANRAFEFVQRRLGLPSDRKIFSFYYFEDTKFYDMPNAFNEFIELYYNTVNGNVDGDHNIARNRWYSSSDSDILRSSGQYSPNNRIAFTAINGKNQILLAGRNRRQSILINSFDSPSGITFSSSITGTSIDSNIYKQGAASIMFNMNNTESTSTITIPSVNYDIRQLLNTNGAYRFYTFFPAGTAGYFTSINIRLISSVGNYYQIAATLDYQGNAWASNGWSLITEPLANAATTGTPNAAAITSIEIDYIHSGTFQNLTGMRIDYLYTVQPDLLDLVFYSAYKGTDSTGTTQKIILDDGADKLSFGSFAPDLIDLIALKAAVKLWPQLRADINFMQNYKQDFNEALLVYGKTYPRVRNSNASNTSLLRD